MSDQSTSTSTGGTVANGELAAEYLARDGLRFDFGSGDDDVRYQVAIADRNNNTLVGGDQRDYLWGLARNDMLAGGGDDDIVHGDRGDDVLIGGMGMDALDGGAGNDSLYGGDDGDNLVGGAGDDLLDEGLGHSMLNGGAGNDTLIGGEGPDAFVVSRTSGDDIIRDFTAGPGMFDHLALEGLRWEDLTFEGTDKGTLVRWDGGSVVLEGVEKGQLAQDDFMFADSPDLPPGKTAPDDPTEQRSVTLETPDIDNGDLPGGRFDKAADAALTNGSLSFDFQGDTTYRMIVGRPGDDDRGGGETSDHIFGRTGNDRYIGYGGDDELNGDAGDDRLDGGAGMDRLDGGSGQDTLLGGGEMDELMGGAGDDFLDEGVGHGMLDGGMGNDTLVGGLGADAFLVGLDSGDDVVFGFEAQGDAQGAFDHIAFQDIRPDQVTVTDSEEGALVSWNTDGSPGAEGSIQLMGVTAGDLRQSDFMFGGPPGFVDGVSNVGSWFIFS